MVRWVQEDKLFRCPACGNIHAWSRSGCFCKQTRFWIYYNLHPECLDDINKVIMDAVVISEEL